MDEQTKKDLSKLAREAETKLARSVLRWKYKREDKEIPKDAQLDEESRHVAHEARRIIGQRAKTAWAEVKKACSGDGAADEGNKK